MNQYTFKPSLLSFLFFATGPHIDSMHEPAELSQNKLRRLEFDNPFMRSASLIFGWLLCLAPLQRRGEVAHWRDTAQLILIALLPYRILAAVFAAPFMKVKVSDFSSNVQQSVFSPFFPGPV